MQQYPMSEQLPLQLNRSKYRAEFANWLSENPHVWSAFCAKANAIWNRGRTHYSGRTIVEVLRYESTLTETSGPWKIRNDFIPDMCRLYADTFPGRSSLFETRSSALRAA